MFWYLYFLCFETFACYAKQMCFETFGFLRKTNLCLYSYFFLLKVLVCYTRQICVCIRTSYFLCFDTFCLLRKTNLCLYSYFLCFDTFYLLCKTNLCLYSYFCVLKLWVCYAKQMCYETFCLQAFPSGHNSEFKENKKQLERKRERKQ